MVEHMDVLALVDFNLVARHGGVGRAARATGRPKATLSRRVVELDASLQIRLFERGERATWQPAAPAGKPAIAIEPVLGLGSLFMVRDPVRLGVGAAQLPLSLLSHDLAAGTLVSWGEMDAPEISLWALYPSRRLLSARVSAFLAYLKEAFPNGTPEELAAYIAG